MSKPDPLKDCHSQAESSTPQEAILVESSITSVHAEPIGVPAAQPVVPPDRRLSMLAWAVAVVLFIFNRKVGLVFFIILLVFRQYPTFSLKSLPGKAGSLYRKIRS